ncbi:MAG: hypothetical protein C4524_06460 [Candidatus Zixiibacteriota bacterium]|nr:MAG: hypothetical protein C4524_06460 [candidate division Zixibacteria bacterium]
MYDRLKSVRASRNIRNVSLALSLVAMIEFLFLFYLTMVQGENYLLISLFLLVLSLVTGFLAYYYHGRFRNRD